MGESKIVSISLTKNDLSIKDNAGKPKLLPGKILISVGGSQPDATVGVPIIRQN